MSEIKISVSERLDKILQDTADDIGIKKAELVKNLVIRELIDSDFNKKIKLNKSIGI